MPCQQHCDWLASFPELTNGTDAIICVFFGCFDFGAVACYERHLDVISFAAVGL